VEVWGWGQIGMDAMRTHKTALLTTLFALIASVSSAQNAGPSTDESVRPPIATDASTAAVAGRETPSDNTFSAEEIALAAGTFFGKTSGAMGTAVERIFRDQGKPLGYIRGEEVSGAVGVGLRYGKGTLVMKDGQERPVYWQGPSIGVDTGGNASKVFTLVYNLDNPDGLYRRYPGVEGSAFFVAGVSVTYQRAEGVTLAPMRTGVGFRAGVNAGYTAYSKRRRWFPL
jgi:hypothetical protein